MEKVKSLNMDLNLYNFNMIKRNHKSLDALNDAIKMHNQNVFTRQSECFTKSLINPIIEKLEKDSSDITEKKERYAKAHKAGNSLLNIKINNHTLQPTPSIELKRITKSQFLKTHVSEIFKYDRFPKRPQKTQNIGGTYVNSKNYTLINANNIQIEKNSSTALAKFRMSAAGFSSAFKFDLSENIKLDKISSNVPDIPSNKYVVSKCKYRKESEKSITNRLKSLISIEEDAEDMTENMSKCIPFLIEKKAKLDEVKS